MFSYLLQTETESGIGKMTRGCGPLGDGGGVRNFAGGAQGRFKKEGNREELVLRERDSGVN